MASQVKYKKTKINRKITILYLLFFMSMIIKYEQITQ